MREGRGAESSYRAEKYLEGRRQGLGEGWKQGGKRSEERGSLAGRPRAAPGTSQEEETDLGTSAASLVSPLSFRGDLLRALRHQGPRRGGSAMNPSMGGCRSAHELQETGGVSEPAWHLPWRCGRKRLGRGSEGRRLRGGTYRKDFMSKPRVRICPTTWSQLPGLERLRPAAARYLEPAEAPCRAWPRPEARGLGPGTEAAWACSWPRLWLVVGWLGCRPRWCWLSGCCRLCCRIRVRGRWHFGSPVELGIDSRVVVVDRVESSKLGVGGGEERKEKQVKGSQWRRSPEPGPGGPGAGRVLPDLARPPSQSSPLLSPPPPPPGGLHNPAHPEGPVGPAPPSPWPWLSLVPRYLLSEQTSRLVCVATEASEAAAW